MELGHLMTCTAKLNSFTETSHLEWWNCAWTSLFSSTFAKVSGYLVLVYLIVRLLKVVPGTGCYCYFMVNQLANDKWYQW